MISDGPSELGSTDDLTGILMIINHSFLKLVVDVIDSDHVIICNSKEL